MCPSLHRLRKSESVKCYQFMPYCAFSNAILKYEIYYTIVYICDVYFCMNDLQPVVLRLLWPHMQHLLFGQSEVISFIFFFFWEIELQAL